MYLILCWSYLNHSLRFVGIFFGIKQKNRILNRNRNYWGKKSQLDYFPKSFSPNTHTHTHKHTHTHTHYSTPQIYPKRVKIQILRPHNQQQERPDETSAPVSA